MWLLSLSILREGNTIGGNWNNIPDLPKTNPSLTPPPGSETHKCQKEAPRKHLSDRGLLALSQNILWTCALMSCEQHLPPARWSGTVQGGAVNSGGSCENREGGVSVSGCRMGISLAHHTASLPGFLYCCQWDTQPHATGPHREGLYCGFIFYQPVFTFSTPLPPPSFILTWKYISTPVLWPEPVPPCLVILSDTIFTLFPSPT